MFRALGAFLNPTSHPECCFNVHKAGRHNPLLQITMDGGGGDGGEGGGKGGGGVAGELEGGSSVPRATEAKAIFWAPLGPKSVIPRCSWSVCIGGS